MQKPFVSMLMMTSIDGKIDGDFIDKHNEWLGNYYEELKLQISDAWGNGSNTHKKYFSDESVDLSSFVGVNVDFTDNVIKGKAPYAVCFDTTGKVKWRNATLIYPENVVNSVIVVTTHKAKAEYIAYLKANDIAYIFADDKNGEKINIKIALNKLYTLFGIKRFALTGGAIINAEFLKENLVDEIRLVIAPFIDGTKNATICESVNNTALTKAFKFDECKNLKEDGLLLVYKKVETH